MLDDFLDVLRCPDCRSETASLALIPFTADKPIQQGIAQCMACRSWYPIEDGVLELLPAGLRDGARRDAFLSRHGSRFADTPKSATAPEIHVQQKVQRDHFDWYADNEKQTYEAYQAMPVWRAFDNKTLGRWHKLVGDESLILDLACGDGRCALSFPSGHRVLGIDISRGQIANALRRSRSVTRSGRTAFIVADASEPPVRKRSFDAVTSYGALHHLPSPRAGLLTSLSLLKPKGIFLAAEPNLSLFRPLFDILMRVLPIWHEVANDEPLISGEMVKGWLNGHAVDLRTATSVFLPPHLINMMGFYLGSAMFRWSDALCSRIPMLRNNGGLIMIEVRAG